MTSTDGNCDTISAPIGNPVKSTITSARSAGAMRSFPSATGAGRKPPSAPIWVNGNSAGSASVDSSGAATLNYLIGLPQGLYTIHARFTSSHPEWFAGSTGDNSLTVTRENAKVTPRSSNPLAVKVNTAGGTAGPITLCADITEFADGSLGNIAYAVPVTFTLVPVAGGATITQIATVTGGGVGGTLAACLNSRSSSPLVVSQSRAFFSQWMVTSCLPLGDSAMP